MLGALTPPPLRVGDLHPRQGRFGCCTHGQVHLSTEGVLGVPLHACGPGVQVLQPTPHCAAVCGLPVLHVTAVASEAGW